MVIDALRVVFIAARSRKDVDLDRDMELLVSVFDNALEQILPRRRSGLQGAKKPT